jgi:hypothetical protein
MWKSRYFVGDHFFKSINLLTTIWNEIYVELTRAHEECVGIREGY